MSQLQLRFGNETEDLIDSTTECQEAFNRGAADAQANKDRQDTGCGAYCSGWDSVMLEGGAK
jgi:hypothetical protein